MNEKRRERCPVCGHERFDDERGFACLHCGHFSASDIVGDLFAAAFVIGVGMSVPDQLTWLRYLLYALGGLAIVRASGKTFSALGEVVVHRLDRVFIAKRRARELVRDDRDIPSAEIADTFRREAIFSVYHTLEWDARSVELLLAKNPILLVLRRRASWARPPQRTDSTSVSRRGRAARAFRTP
jgi:hypothetical protein